MFQVTSVAGACGHACRRSFVWLADVLCGVGFRFQVDAEVRSRAVACGLGKLGAPCP